MAVICTNYSRHALDDLSTMPALTGTLAQQRVLVAVQAALGAMYEVEWITRADTGMMLLFVQHRRRCITRSMRR